MNCFSLNGFLGLSACLLLPFLTACNLSIPPKPTEFLGDNIDDWKTHFQIENEDLWSVSDGKLIFQGSEEINKLTLPLNDIPSDLLKPGRITAHVEMNGIFKEADQHSFYGFELANAVNSIKFGLTGAGTLVAFDNDMLPLPIKVSRNENCTPRQENADVLLSFAMYGNKKGWTIDFGAKNCKEVSQYMLRAFIATETKEKFDKLSLVAYKPANSDTPVWFRNLTIWKDWAPFD